MDRINISPRARCARSRRQSGQSVIIAVVVMFLLAFLAALFITLVARNYQRVNRSSQVLDADYYARAGIQYANQMLLTSPQGADWRPPLTHQLGMSFYNALTPAEQNAYTAATTANNLTARNDLDPDGYWLDQGFSRYNINGGRFLLRLSYGYNPPASAASGASSPYGIEATEPEGKYIKIESIGRTGEIDDSKPEDPTVFFAQPIRLHAELIAYKPIGLLDYSRFITNKDNRADTFNLGVPSSLILPATSSTAVTNASSNAIVTSDVYDFADDPSNTSAPSLMQYPIITTYGDPNAPSKENSQYLGAGGSLRCNGNLRLYGTNAAFLDGTVGDDWEIAGDLTFDGYSNYANYSTSATGTPPSGPVNPTQLTVVGTDPMGDPVNQQGIAGTVYPRYAYPDPANATPSNVTSLPVTSVLNGTAGYDSINGLIRDGSSDNDVYGNPRSVGRLNPPSLDVVDPSDNLTRYQALCETGTGSAPPTSDTTVTSTTVLGGPYQQETASTPATVFIDNAGDTQPETTNIESVAYTLRDDWLNRTSQYWIGPFYNPPGASIVFGPERYTVNGSTTVDAWGFTITRSDTALGSTGATEWNWINPNSTTRTGETTPLVASSVTFVYGQPQSGFVFDPTKPVYFLNADNPTPGTQTAAYTTGTAYTNNDIVIYAEGNVRVRGIVSPTTTTYDEPGQTAPDAHHVTIVTDQIAYIDGSILKGGANYSPVATTGSSVYVPAYQSDSSIALLAERYVCVNTTQFTAGSFVKNDLNTTEADPTTGAIDFGADNNLTEEYDFPPVSYATALPASEPNDALTPTMLYMSEYAASSDSSGDGGVGGLAQGDLNISVDAFGGTTQFETDADSSGTAFPYGIGSSGSPNRVAFPSADGLFPNSTAGSGQTVASRIDLTFSKDSQSQQDWELERAALLPSDVRIEATLYAQDNSFFVIPGPWFNSDGQDTVNNYAASWSSTTGNVPNRANPFFTASASGPAGQVDQYFPFYGQPIDMKITIDGSVVENVPADISDQQAWMTKWGWIPRFQGDPILAPGSAAAGPYLSPHSQEPGFMPLPAIASMLAVPSAETSTIPGIGLNITYDFSLGAASVRSSSALVDHYMRLDEYGRPLPAMPNLPVSPDLLYSGQTTDNSLVQ